jgi:hypothetical protein
MLEMFGYFYDLLLATKIWHRNENIADPFFQDHGGLFHYDMYYEVFAFFWNSFFSP